MWVLFLSLRVVTFPKLALTILVGDERCLVLNETPLFMFVKPLALLISNIFYCF
jgi:hypothetical protein